MWLVHVVAEPTLSSSHDWVWSRHGVSLIKINFKDVQMTQGSQSNILWNFTSRPVGKMLPDVCFLFGLLRGYNVSVVYWCPHQLLFEEGLFGKIEVRTGMGLRDWDRGGDRDRDGRGIVTDKKRNTVKDGVEVESEGGTGTGTVRRVFFCCIMVILTDVR